MQDHKKLKILFMNTYPKEKDYDMYKRGLLPGHHLFGTVELRKDYNMDVIVPRHEGNSLLNTIGNWFDIGFLDQQVRALFMLRQCDILYAPQGASNTKLIMLFKLFGLIRKPLVILVQHRLFGKPSKNKWARLMVKKLILSYDTLIFLSHTMRTDLIKSYDIDPVDAKNQFFIFNWGVDMDFFKKYSSENIPEVKPIMVSAGNTARDFDILVRASERINFPFKIYCKPNSFPKSAITKNIEILCGDFPFEQICKDYADARIILIPLATDSEAPNGLTSLLDAMAMGTPIIMTKNEKVDIDFQNEKIGLIVEENSVEGWVEAISHLLENYSLLKEMGDNILRLGNEKFHINIFARNLALSLEDTYERYVSKS